MVASHKECGWCGMVEAPWAGPRVFPEWGGGDMEWGWYLRKWIGREWERMRKVQVRRQVKKGELRSPRKRMAPSVT